MCLISNCNLNFLHGLAAAAISYQLKWGLFSDPSVLRAIVSAVRLQSAGYSGSGREVHHPIDEVAKNSTEFLLYLSFLRNEFYLSFLTNELLSIALKLL
jgi:hypothetical protein